MSSIYFKDMNFSSGSYSLKFYMILFFDRVVGGTDTHKVTLNITLQLEDCLLITPLRSIYYRPIVSHMIFHVIFHCQVFIAEY
jgi:hypothetical protein